MTNEATNATTYTAAAVSATIARKDAAAMTNPYAVRTAEALETVSARLYTTTQDKIVAGLGKTKKAAADYERLNTLEYLLITLEGAAREAVRTHKPLTIYTQVISVAGSGMSRNVCVLIRTEDGISNVSHYMQALGYKYNRKDRAAHVAGCGFDAGYDLAMAIASAAGLSHADYGKTWRHTTY